MREPFAMGLLVALVLAMPIASATASGQSNALHDRSDAPQAVEGTDVAVPVAKPPPRPKAPEGSQRSLAALAGGRILVASRQLNGPFFAESVVLLLDYDPDGAVGLIINRKTNVPLPELLPEVEKLGGRRDHVYVGGPVDPRRMVFLIRSETPPADSRHVVADVHATGSADALRGIIAEDVPESRFRAYVGYAGWAPGQLDSEVARGDWYIEEAVPKLIFDDAVGDLWQRLVRGHEGVHVRLQMPVLH